VVPQPAPEHELLRRRDRRDRIDLEKAQAANRVEDVAGGAVEELRADSDPACLLESDDPRADAESLDGQNVDQRVDDTRIEMRAGARAELGSRLRVGTRRSVRPASGSAPKAGRSPAAPVS
jgi:hypothetical protein